MAVITISRLYGLAGRQFGLELARRLGYDYLDKEILARLSDSLDRDEENISLYEETGYGPSTSLLAMLTRKYPVSESDFPTPEDYGRALEEIIRDVAARGRVVIVGRGSQKILAGLTGSIHLRLVAGEATLAGGIAAKRRFRTCTPGELHKALKRQNAARADFVRQHFKIDWSDPLHYDLVINFDRVSRPEAVDLAVTLAALRDPESEK